MLNEVVQRIIKRTKDNEGYDVEVNIPGLMSSDNHLPRTNHSYGSIYRSRCTFWRSTSSTGVPPGTPAGGRSLPGK
eukprot:43774-Amphidinium_carterae.1